MGREGHYIIAPKRLDERLHHQNVLEREGDILLYMKCTVHVIESEYVLCIEIWAI